MRSLANWFSLGDLAGDKSRDEMSVPEGEAYDNLLRDLTNVRRQNNISGVDFKRSQANTQLIRDATETLEFNSIEQLEQAREENTDESTLNLDFREPAPCLASQASWPKEEIWQRLWT